MGFLGISKGLLWVALKKYKFSSLNMYIIMSFTKYEGSTFSLRYEKNPWRLVHGFDSIANWSWVGGPIPLEIASTISTISKNNDFSSSIYDTNHVKKAILKSDNYCYMCAWKIHCHFMIPSINWAVFPLQHYYLFSSKAFVAPQAPLFCSLSTYVRNWFWF